MWIQSFAAESLMRQAGVSFVRSGESLDAAQYGARKGLAYVCDKPKISIKVFLFNHQDDQSSAIKKIEREPLFAEEGIKKWAQNGALLLIGETDGLATAHEGGPETLQKLISAFSGEE